MESTSRAIEPFLVDLLAPISARWGIRLDEQALQRFARYADELVRWNERVNLTRITSPRDIVVRHFLDSLACAQGFPAPPSSLIDVGTGAGFPGLPLKIIWPDARVVLSDSIGKKTAFLRHIVTALELDNVEVVTARAEELGRDPAHREQYEGVVARAVADLAVLAEYCLPLCHLGGRFIAPKGASGIEEAAAAQKAITRLGGHQDVILPVALPDLDPRTLVVIRKVQPTPVGLPRPTGVPGKQPL
jgi:16S rRNA (guanine527-N7)-methyltransferase